MKMQHGKITIGMCAIAPGTADDVSHTHKYKAFISKITM